jgi:2-haloacid dehalogenase
VFKPDARIYRLACDRLGVGAGQIAFVSSNGWDIAGAARFGFRTIWVNRARAPMDRLPHRPGMLPDLSPLARSAEATMTPKQHFTASGWRAHRL